jgi:hypothetical protein
VGCGAGVVLGPGSEHLPGVDQVGVGDAVSRRKCADGGAVPERDAEQVFTWLHDMSGAAPLGARRFGLDQRRGQQGSQQQYQTQSRNQARDCWRIF